MERQIRTDPNISNNRTFLFNLTVNCDRNQKHLGTITCEQISLHILQVGSMGIHILKLSKDFGDSFPEG